MISGNFNIKLLTTLDEKKRILNDLGIDYLYIIKFSERFSKKTYKEFFDEILIETVKVKHLVIGYDHKFGKGRDGDINKLVEYSKSKKNPTSKSGLFLDLLYLRHFFMTLAKQTGLAAFPVNDQHYR